MNNRIVVFSSNGNRYISDLVYLQTKTSFKFKILLYGDNSSELKPSDTIEYVQSLKQVKKIINKHDIIMGYGGCFGGVPFEHIPYFLSKYKYFSIPDGITDNDWGLHPKINEKSHKLSLYIKYVKFYGIINFIKIIFKTLFIVKAHKINNFKNYGILEFSRMLEYDKKMNTPPNKQILILEQPFLQHLGRNETKKIFTFIDDLCKENIDYKIIFKIHPRSNKDFYKKNIKSPNIILESGDIIEHIKKSEYIMGFFSTALFTGLIYNKKVIVIDPIGIFKDIKKFDLLQYPNTGYMENPNKVENVKLSKGGKRIDNLLFNFDKFEYTLNNT